MEPGYKGSDHQLYSDHQLQPGYEASDHQLQPGYEGSDHQLQPGYEASDHQLRFYHKTVVLLN